MKTKPKKFTVEKEYNATRGFRFNWSSFPAVGTKFEEVDNSPHFWTVVSDYTMAGMIECESSDEKYLGYQLVFPHQKM